MAVVIESKLLTVTSNPIQVSSVFAKRFVAAVQIQAHRNNGSACYLDTTGADISSSLNGYEFRAPAAGTKLDEWGAADGNGLNSVDLQDLYLSSPGASQKLNIMVKYRGHHRDV